MANDQCDHLDAMEPPLDQHMQASLDAARATLHARRSTLEALRRRGGRRGMACKHMRMQSMLRMAYWRGARGTYAGGGGFQHRALELSRGFPQEAFHRRLSAQSPRAHTDGSCNLCTAAACGTAWLKMYLVHELCRGYGRPRDDELGLEMMISARTLFGLHHLRQLPPSPSPSLLDGVTGGPQRRG